jgi:PBSX family phage terminase large subunit
MVLNKTLRLLPHQYNLIADEETKILGLVSGFGAGKSFAVARKAVKLSLQNPGFDSIVCEPTFPLLAQILIPELKDALDYFGVPYQYKSGENIFYCEIDGKETRIICKSMESYERLIGINASHVILDEFDVARPDVAYKAYQKLLGRIRVGNVRQMVMVSTPEGFGAFYRIFVEEAGPMKRLIRAKTTDNYHLPPDYIETMREQYPAELIEAYINGEFTNLTTGTVYKQFDRSFNNTMVQDNPMLPIHIGMDFNVTKMSAVGCLLADNKCYAVKEHIDIFDTPEMIEVLKREYQGRQVFIYPDASGQSRKSIDANGSDIKLLKSAGFKVVVDSKNPNIMDRVAAMNKMICNAKGERKFYVNTLECPKLTSALEKQAYDEATNMPDKKSGFDNEGIDAVGYLIQKLFPVKVEKPKARLMVRHGGEHNGYRPHQ